MKVLFYNPLICIRGTSVAIYDYAHYNETILGNISDVIVSSKADHNRDILRKYQRRFRVHMYNTDDELYDIAKNYDVMYVIKYGHRDGVVSAPCKLVIHCVFDMTQPHGDVYAGVSKTLANKFNSPLYVQHMINLIPRSIQQSMRSKLNIPESAIVFGRHGGKDTFNLPYAFDVISEVLANRDDIHFILVNTHRGVEHSNVHYIDSITDIEEKKSYIESCDAYIELGTLGHTFGLSIGEFSVYNKPIIAFNGACLWNRSHLDILGDKGIYFDTKESLLSILLSFNPEDYRNRDMNCYKDYSPSKVMKKFKEVFLG